MSCSIFIDGNVKKSRFSDFIIASEGSKRGGKIAFFGGFGACFQLQVTLENFLEVFRPQPRYLKYPRSVDVQADINYMAHRCFKHIIFAIEVTPLLNRGLGTRFFTVVVNLLGPPWAYSEKKLDPYPLTIL